MNTDTSTLDTAATQHGEAAAAALRQSRRIARFDARGCPISTRSQAATEHAEEAQWRLLSYCGDALKPLDAAIAADPQWALPHLMKANMMACSTEYGYGQLGLASLQAAQALAAHANERERAHMHATALCLQGQWLQACEAWEAILIEYPQDLTALVAAHLFDFCRGDARNLQRRVTRVLPQWSREMPLYGFVLGMHAFGLEENNHYAQAMEAGQAALAFERRDVWAVHAIAHVHEMRGEYEEGAAFLRSRMADWSIDNGFAFHNWWHLALFELERLDTTAVLELFDQRIARGGEQALQRIDATAMLWRLKLLGVDVGARWQAAAEAWPRQAPEAGHYAFSDLHAVLALLGAGRLAEAEAIGREVQRKSAEASTTGEIAAQVGLPLLHALMAYGRSHYAEAARALWALRDGCHRFGGSHAQRDIVDQTLLDAALRSGQQRLARHLLNERLLMKDRSPLTQHWARRIN